MISWNKEHAKNTPKSEWVKAHSHLGTKQFLEAEHDKLNGKEAEAETEQPIADAENKAKKSDK